MPVGSDRVPRARFLAYVLKQFQRSKPLIARWTPEQIASEKAAIELESVGVDAEHVTIEQSMRVVDYLVHRYLGADDTRTEAEWQVSRAAMMVRVQAAMDEVEETPVQADSLAPLPAPERVDSWRRQHVLSGEENAVLAFGREHCCESIPGLTDSDRRRMRDLIMDWQEATYMGNRAKTAESLQTKLFDKFGILNRDMREIAVTETTNNLGNGLIASLAPGTRVKRVERASDGCAFCRSIDGHVLTVVDPAKEDKNPATEVWAGKDSLRRSRNWREGNDQVDLERGNGRYVPAGAVHDGCTGRWIVLESSKLPVDPKFSAWMDEVLGRSPTPE
jgi:hypothetical protein